jgi:hypothetical protein
VTAKWDEAQWGVDKWAALTVAELLQQPPATGRGVPTGLGDWRLSVEILLPADQNAVWGRAVWGEATWNYLAWRDLTPVGARLGMDEGSGRTVRTSACR